MHRRNFLATLAVLPLAVRLKGGSCEVTGNIPSTLQYPELPAGLQTVFAVGDFGTGGSHQKKVAARMNEYAAMRKPLAIVSTGDNIYPSGVNSPADPQWKAKFENIYNLEHLKDLSWIAVLGNHDYRGSTRAQVQYGELNKHWIMPDIYHATPCPGAETKVTFICLDTQMILKQNQGWLDQLSWLEKTLSETTSAFKVIVGHHPMRSYGHYQDQAFMLKNVKPLLESYGAQAYVCGHDHDMQIIQHPQDTFTCVVSGGGGGCRSTAWGTYTKAAYAKGGFAALHFGTSQLFAELIDIEGKSRGLVPVVNR